MPFYITKQDGDMIETVAGPFKTRAEAEAKFEDTIEIAIRKDPFAAYYTFEISNKRKEVKHENTGTK